MPQVRVYNDNKYPYREKFMDRDIEIDAHQYILMDESEAIKFRGSFVAPTKKADGTFEPMSFKMIRLAPHTQETVVKEAEKFVCQFDGTEHPTKEALEKYIDENHLDKLSDQEFAKERKKKAK